MNTFFHAPNDSTIASQQTGSEKQDPQVNSFIRPRRPRFPPHQLPNPNSELEQNNNPYYQFELKHFTELHRKLGKYLPEISQCGGNMQDWDLDVNKSVSEIGNIFAEFNQGIWSTHDREHILEAQEQLEDDGGAEDVESLIFKNQNRNRYFYMFGYDFDNEQKDSASHTKEVIVNRFEDPETAERWRIEEEERERMSYYPLNIR
ncbi:MAG: hypothetical protein EZS28_039818 [Streblomastix strix]|uniref:Uncharacterized protein n=1 Tax=Streblomastix strix TaxID=222440 RepID=A0A5J4U1Q7_9EUKA|nr:MAG: hypothetical protein EZS28_039818 [Streblomastix strix]